MTDEEVEIVEPQVIPVYDPNNWYWKLNGDESQYWSSLLGTFIDAAELPVDAGVTNISGNEETSAELLLTNVLRAAGIKRTPIILKSDVHEERDRRLGLGFDYDFGDERGVHHIATTPGDMIGWNEVTTWATVQTVLGNVTATLAVKTETGAAIITPPEWLAVLGVATAFRQPIWAKSFELESMDPIPWDYTADFRWE